MMKSIYYILLGLTLAFVAQTASSHQTFNQFVIFGDSLSDNGNFSLIKNINFSPKVKAVNELPVFTTNPGQTAFVDVANNLGFRVKPSYSNPNTRSIDYAVGGAGINNNNQPGPIPTISNQVDTYIKSNNGHVNSHAIYGLWGGANDIYYQAKQINNGNETPKQAKNEVVKAAHKEVSLIRNLHQHGARKIIVFNLYDFGKTPGALKKGSHREKVLTNFTKSFNSNLNAGLSNQKGVIPVDIYGLTKEISDNPAHYGFKNITQTACTNGALLCAPQGSGAYSTYKKGTQNTYLYANGVHPTSGAQAAFAQAALSELRAPKKISLLGESPVASANAQLRNINPSVYNYPNNRVFTDFGYKHQTFNSPQAYSNNVNLTLGVNHPITQNVSVGLAFGGGHASTSINHGRGGYNMTTVSGTGYIAYHNKRTYVNAKIGYSHLYFKNIERRFPIGAAIRTETGNTDGDQIYGELSTGHNFYLTQHLNSGPFGRVEWQHIHINGYSENGYNSTAMSFGSIKNNVSIFTLGWNLQSTYQLLGKQIHPYSSLAWHHKTQTHPIMVTAKLKSMNDQFTLPGYNPDSNWGTVNAGVSIDFSRSSRLTIGYQRRFASKQQSFNSVELGLDVSF